MAYALMIEQLEARVLGERHALITAVAMMSAEDARKAADSIPDLAVERERFDRMLEDEFATPGNTPQFHLRKALGVKLRGSGR